MLSRLENANAKTCFFITEVRGQISANERAQDDECHLTVVEKKDQLMTRS